jgi:O-antigen/teichoic acid export membrane protein
VLIHHSILYLVGRIVPAGVGMIALALYTRLLTPEQYGLYALVIAAMSMVNAVFFHWLSLSVSRFLPANEHQPHVLLNTALWAFLVLTLVSGLLGSLVTLVRPDDSLRIIILLTVALSWAQGWFDLNLQIINARLQPVRYGVLSSVKALLALGMGLLLFYLGLGVAGILTGLVIALLASSAMELRHWHGRRLQGKNAKLLKELMSYGLPLALSFILMLTLYVSDRFLLGWLLDSETVGEYAAAYDLAYNSLGVVTGVVHLAAFPLAVRAMETRAMEAVHRQLRDNGHLLLAVSLPATVGLAMLANNIAGVVLGADFRTTAAIIIIWVAIGIFVGGIKSYYLDYSFQLARRMDIQVWTIGIAAIVNVCLNLLLIPGYGMVGAAYATVCGFSVAFLVGWHLGRKILPLPFPRQVYKPIAASCCMAFALWPTIDWKGGQNLLIQIAVGVGAYTMAFFALSSGKLVPAEISAYFSGKIR